MSTRSGGRREQAGSVLVTAVVVAMVLGSILLVAVTVSRRNQQEAESASGELNAFYAADAGLSAALVELRNGGDGELGSEQAPVALGGLAYWVTATPAEATVTSLAAAATAARRPGR